MILEDIQISFSITSSVREALTSSDILIELEAPSGERMVLHDGSRIEPTILANASYPNETTPLGTKPTWAAFKRSILTTRGNWTLHVQNKAPVAIKVQNVSILLVGQPVIDIYGRVLNTDGSGVASADISLSGTPFSLVFPSYSDENGDFVIPRIPAMPINLSASHPAFDGGASIQIEQLAPRFVGTTSNASEMALSEQFGDRPLPAAPPGSLGVPGYGDLGESSNQPFKINLEGKGGDPSIFAFPPSSAPGQVLEFHSVGNIGKGSFLVGFWRRRRDCIRCQRDTCVRQARGL